MQLYSFSYIPGNGNLPKILSISGNGTILYFKNLLIIALSITKFLYFRGKLPRPKNKTRYFLFFITFLQSSQQ